MFTKEYARAKTHAVTPEPHEKTSLSVEFLIVISNKLLKKKKVDVQFFERESGFNFKVNINKLTKTDPKWQYTFWHNFFFNPALNENIEILFFSPLKNQLSQIS